ncbi:inosine monophosphate dehydrogenase [Mytilinidion resinicola]|uniref:Inosine monophosphate dehydrogenase n=1 Tax=Mytilinidion resinicola TaxID=574789 RepID=A0A6A6YPK1_9PEZI|nr:inosine monophosphate dehydrogenase [Mytilinidion resinicola]KAF2809905.1 inosine monophosphate dehydrogenase [Mytilinidion resinicola]
MAQNLLKQTYPWIKTPLIIGAPMRLISLAPLAIEVSRAGGIGFIGSGTDTSTLEHILLHAQSLLLSHPIPHSPPTTLPLGIGFINWGASLPLALPLIARFHPAAVWFFAPASLASLASWTAATRAASPATKIWIQIGSVAAALAVTRACAPDVLVVQGTDAGGHGLVRGAGVVSLVPEVADALSALAAEEEGGKAPMLVAAGGIAEARGAAAALALGAGGVVLGTRLLASPEANIADGYRKEVLRARDGGQSTVRTKVYDALRGTTGWGEEYNGRAVVNRSFVDAGEGMGEEENKRLYEAEMEKGDAGWGVEGRMTTYAGAAVGLVKEVKGAADIVEEVREGAVRVLEGLMGEARTKL